MYYQNRSDDIKAEKAYVVEDAVHASVLADLQQKQDQEFYRTITGLTNKANNKLNTRLISGMCSTLV